jgi:hypothetical protein
MVCDPPYGIELDAGVAFVAMPNDSLENGAA